MGNTDRQIARKSSIEMAIGDGPPVDSRPGTLVELAVAALCSTEFYERRLVRGGSVSGTTFEAMEFDECRFETTDMSNTRWDKIRFQDVRLDSCDLANACLTQVMSDNVVWRRCRGVGLQLLDGKCSQVAFDQSLFHLGAFHGSRFRGCRWDRCDLRETNFEGAELVDVIFRNCALRAARFPNSVLTNVDFRGSHLAGMQATVEQLRNALFEPSQLPDLAEVLGLTVKPLDEKPMEEV